MGTTDTAAARHTRREPTSPSAWPSPPPWPAWLSASSTCSTSTPPCTRAEHLFARTRAHVDIDGSALPFDDIGSAQIGAIDIDLGGVVRTFRKARRPGVLHAQVVGMGPAGIVANLPSVVLGTPLVGPRVFDDACERLTMAPASGHRLTPILDGEPYTCPGAISVCAGPALSFASV